MDAPFEDCLQFPMHTAPERKMIKDPDHLCIYRENRKWGENKGSTDCADGRVISSLTLKCVRIARALVSSGEVFRSRCHKLPPSFWKLFSPLVYLKIGLECAKMRAGENARLINQWTDSIEALYRGYDLNCDRGVWCCTWNCSIIISGSVSVSISTGIIKVYICSIGFTYPCTSVRNMKRIFW